MLYILIKYLHIQIRQCFHELFDALFFVFAIIYIKTQRVYAVRTISQYHINDGWFEHHFVVRIMHMYATQLGNEVDPFYNKSVHLTVYCSHQSIF